METAIASPASDELYKAALALLNDSREKDSDIEESVEKRSKAELLLENAAQLGNADAMHQLGLLVSHGAMHMHDYHRMWRHFNDAAKLGHIPSILMFAEGYRTGDTPGISPNREQYRVWLKRAADLGSEIAQTKLRQVAILEAEVQ